MPPLLSALGWVLAPALLVVGYAYVRGGSKVRRYLVIRVLMVVPMVLLMGSFVFLILRALPGDPVAAESAFSSTPAQQALTRQELGLNDPMIEQYGRFMKSVVTLDFGTSVTGGRENVAEALSERLPGSAELVVPATVIAVVFGIATGMIAALRRGTMADHGLRLYSVLSQSMPGFLVGMLLQLIFASWLGWFPVSGEFDAGLIGNDGVTPGGYLLTRSIFSGDWTMVGSVLHHLVLPVLALSWIVVGTNLRVARINMIEAMDADYILAGTARGIKNSVLNYRYAFRNALLPIVTLLGLQVALMLGGTVVIEQVFDWPGLGQYLLEGILARNFPAVQGAIIVITIFVILVSLLVDALYTLIDPRVDL
jgi:peptide/nickel transport system permease protein